jgi:hypoxanthine phosphoribosyltransferase
MMNKLTLDNKQFNGLVGKICRDIANSDWRPDYVVGLTRGGLLPAVMISHYFNVPMNTLKVSLRDNVDTESNLWMAEDAFGYCTQHNTDGTQRGWSDVASRKDILIVDDINDSGATLNWIMEDWRSGCLPNEPIWDHIFGNNVRFAVVVDNLASKCDVKMSYVGMEINKAENDVWVDFHYEDWWTK